MISRARKLSRQYVATLCRYLDRQQESLLQEAYELGRTAIAGGLGVLDVARIHQHALTSCGLPAPGPEGQFAALRAAEVFFLEALSPFEATHRGFRKANLELRQVNAELERRNAELGAMNRELTQEIAERRRAEEALRQSEEHHRQLCHAAQLMQEKLRNLSNQILRVQEEERKHISRELHDEIGQTLTAINTNLTMLQRNGTVESALLKKKIADAQSLLEQTMETVHRFARELRPAMLDELGLLPALRCYLKNFAERTGLRVRFEGNAGAEHLNDDQKTVVFRVAQESLTNVAKHAQASRVQVSVRKLSRGLQVEIKDNGKAFAADQQLAGKDRKRLGLLGMQERVRLVNGHFAVESAPGKGTAVRVEIPFKPDQEKLIYAKNNRSTR